MYSEWNEVYGEVSKSDQNAIRVCADSPRWMQLICIPKYNKKEEKGIRMKEKTSPTVSSNKNKPERKERLEWDT